MLVEDKRSTPADIAATKPDFRGRLRRLDRNRRTAAKLLAGGTTTSDAAKHLKVSSSRVGRLRGELKEAWEEFQRERPAMLTAA